MGFWLLVPGVLMGGAEAITAAPGTGPVICRSVAPRLVIPGSQQPHARV